MYKAQITSNKANYKEKVYIETVKIDFKHKFNNHIKSFNLKRYENNPKLSKEYWAMKCNHFTPKGTWIIIHKCAPLNTIKKKCFLCYNGKLEIASYKKDSLLKKTSELINKCRHPKTSSPFNNMITRTKSYVSTDTEICLPVIPLRSRFGLYSYFLIWFSKQNSRQRFHRRTLEH